MQKKEVWKSIAGYEGHYEASNLGRIRSIDRVIERSNTGPVHKKGRILKTTTNQHGHLKVNLWKRRVGRWLYVHRIVYETFNGEIPKNMHIHHIDENPKNNSLSNLQAIDRHDHISAHGKKQVLSEEHIKAIVKAKSKPVEQLTLDGEIVAQYPSAREAERQTGINNQAINNVLVGKAKTSGGFLWRYLEK